MAYQLDNTGPLFDWLARESDPELRGHVLAWVQVLVDDPEAVASFPLPGERAPKFAAFVPGTEVVVSYLVAEQYRVVRLLSVASIRDLLPPQ